MYKHICLRSIQGQEFCLMMIKFNKQSSTYHPSKIEYRLVLDFTSRALRTENRSCSTSSFKIPAHYFTWTLVHLCHKINALKKAFKCHGVETFLRNYSNSKKWIRISSSAEKCYNKHKTCFISSTEAILFYPKIMALLQST